LIPPRTSASRATISSLIPVIRWAAFWICMLDCSGLSFTHESSVTFEFLVCSFLFVFCSHSSASASKTGLPGWALALQDEFDGWTLLVRVWAPWLMRGVAKVKQRHKKCKVLVPGIMLTFLLHSQTAIGNSSIFDSTTLPSPN
jgi:hypothetical protein